MEKKKRPHSIFEGGKEPMALTGSVFYRRHPSLDESSVRSEFQESLERVKVQQD